RPPPRSAVYVDRKARALGTSLYSGKALSSFVTAKRKRTFSVTFARAILPSKRDSHFRKVTSAPKQEDSMKRTISRSTTKRLLLPSFRRARSAEESSSELGGL